MGPLRRIVPVGWQVWNLRLDGVSPLLMNSAEYDRLGDTYRAYRQLGSKRGKSIEDELRLQELEFHLGLHYDETVGVFVPGHNVKELLRSAATKYRKGEEIKRSLIVPEYRLPLLHNGPSSPAELYEQKFFDVRLVANAGAGSGRVPRCRPKFDPWALETEVAFDPEDLDADLLETVVGRSVKYGFGDGRAIGFGAFVPSFTFSRVQREDSSASALKTRDLSVEKGVRAAVDRITNGNGQKASEPGRGRRRQGSVR